MADLDLDLVRHALATARERGYASLDLELEGGKFHAKLEAKKKVKRAPAASVAAPDSPPQPEYKIVASNHVGYWRSANPPFAAGDEIKQGESVGSIIVLGLPNDLESKFTGVIEEVFVEDDAAVQFGQPIFRVRPS